MTRFDLAQELQNTLFAHPQSGPIPISASLITLVMEELRRPPSGEMVCPDCGSRHLRVIYECFNERCDWRGSLSAAEASKEAK